MTQMTFSHCATTWLVYQGWLPIFAHLFLHRIMAEELGYCMMPENTVRQHRDEWLIQNIRPR